MRITKRVCAVALSTLAFTAFPAAVATGSVPEFQAGSYSADVHGESTAEEGHVFEIEAGHKLVCKNVTATGQLVETSTTVTLEPTYSACTVSLLSATVAPNECVYEFEVGAEASEAKFEGTVDVVCPAGKAIVVTAGTCEIQIGSQQALGKVEYANETAAEPPRLKATLAVTGVKYSKTKDGFLCPLNGTGEKADGVYAGNTQVTAQKGTQKLPVGVAYKTKLCKVKPQVFCPKDQRYLMSTAIESSGGQEIEIEKDVVKCQKSQGYASLFHDEGAPLMLQLYSLELTECRLNEKTDCAKIPLSYGSEGWLKADRKKEFGGWMEIRDASFVVSCGAGFNCKYESNLFQQSFVTVSDKQVELHPQGAFGAVKMAGEAGCSAKSAKFGYANLLTKPIPAWLSH